MNDESLFKLKTIPGYKPIKTKAIKQVKPKHRKVKVRDPSYGELMNKLRIIYRED